MIDGGNKITHSAFSIFIEHAEANEFAPRRHPTDSIQLRLLVFNVVGIFF